MKRLLFPLFLWALAAPALAQGHWPVTGDYTSCTMSSPDQQISLVWGMEKPRVVRVHVRSEELNALASSNPVKVGLQFEFGAGEPNSWDNETSILANSQGSSTAILRIDDAELLTALAEASYVMVLVEYEEVLKVPLVGSSDAMSRFRQCMARVRTIDDRVHGRRRF